MDYREAMIPAVVKDFTADNDVKTAYDPFCRAVHHATRRSYKMTVELCPRNDAEVDWLVRSIQENGMRLMVLPDDSPIMHPQELRAASFAPPKPDKTDQPKEVAGLIW